MGTGSSPWTRVRQCLVPSAFPAPASTCVLGHPELPPRRVVGKEEEVTFAKFMRCSWPYTSHLPCRRLLQHPLYFSHLLREVVKSQVNTRVLIHSLGT